ncbi:MAG: hypothetical protein HG427_005935 [Flavobacteriaceae bacterium]|jgi:membrane protein|nr:hypothetical protein [Flavobacteriaceae bacterium]
MRIEKTIFLLTALFFILLQGAFVLLGDNAVLSDDLNHLEILYQYQEGKYSISDVYNLYTSDPNRHTRPISPIVITLATYLGGFWTPLFFIHNFLFPIAAWLLKLILDKFFSEYSAFTLLVCILATIFPLSSSNLFSFVMGGVSWVYILYFLSLMLLTKKNLHYHLISGLLLGISLLFYELHLFLIPLSIFILVITNREKKLLKLSLSIGLGLFIAAFYKFFLVKIIYPEHFDYAASKVTFSLSSSFILIFSFFKLFILDFAYIAKQSILAISDYSGFDYILLTLGLIISGMVSIFCKFDKTIPKRYFLVFLSIFLMTVVVFFISQYPMTSFSFENRILLWVKISSSLLLGYLIYNGLAFTKKKSYQNFLKIILFLFLSTNFICVISEKNSWIYASNYNKNLIKSLGSHLPKNIKDEKIVIIQNDTNYDKLITDEKTLKASYEMRAALVLYTPQVFINGANIYRISTKDTYLYSIFGKKLNNRPRSEIKETETGFILGKDKINFPFYVFDYADNSLHLVKNKSDYNKFLK